MLHRTALVSAGAGAGAGAVVQFGGIWNTVRVFGDPPALIPPPVTAMPRPAVALHAVRAALCIVVALATSQAAGLSHSYWAALTAMIALKPGLHGTATRTLERIGGTLAGICVATVGALPATLAPGADRWMLAAGALLASAAAFGLQQARYSVLSGAITATVLLLAAFAGESILDTDFQRLTTTLTLLGGGVAVAGAAIAQCRLLPHGVAGKP